MTARRFSDEGTIAFEEFILALRRGEPRPYPSHLLTDAQKTEPLDQAIDVERGRFSTKYEAAEYFYNLFSQSGMRNVEADKGLWTWLAFFYFEELCPVDRARNWKPHELARYVLESWHERSYMHALAGPYRVYAAHAASKQMLRRLLAEPVTSHSDFYLETAKRQVLVSNPGVLEAIVQLYVDPSTGRPRSNISRDEPGGVRRLAKVISQLDCTWDICSLSADQILDLLPREFDGHKLAAARSLQPRSSSRAPSVSRRS